MAELLPLLLGGVCGAVMGLVGAGGTLIAVPALVLVLGLPMAQAVPVSLLAVTAAGLVGTVLGLRAGMVRYRAAALIAAAGVAVAPLGFHLGERISESWLQILFAAVVSVAAIRIWRGAAVAGGEGSGRPLARRSAETGRFLWSWSLATGLAALGAFVGGLAGLLGVGGGFAVVPALRRYSDLPMRAAVATSLMSLTLISAGAVGQLAVRGELNFPPQGLPFLSAAVIGLALGLALARRIRSEWLQRGLAVLLLSVSVTLLIRAISHS